MTEAQNGLVAEALTIEIEGRVLVEDASLTVQPGECVALLGPNGAGKSTLLRALVGRMAPQSGTTSVNDATVTDLSAQYADRILWMKEGQIIADGTPSETLTAERLNDVYGIKAQIIKNCAAPLGVIIDGRDGDQTSQ
ncbi:MAG: ATP-binding cassette domain-containing protein [Pseudomonadota bacterium]